MTVQRQPRFATDYDRALPAAVFGERQGAGRRSRLT